MKKTAAAVPFALLALLAAPARAGVSADWELPLAALYDGVITVAAVNEAAPLVTDGPRRRFIIRTARGHGLPADLLLGAYGACTDNGRERRDTFCLDIRRNWWLPGRSYRDPPRSRSFRADARAAARGLARLHRMLY